MNKIVDIHSHIIPAIDDGSKSMEMTLEMLKQSIENKVYSIVATPHYRVGICQKSYSELKEIVKNLNNGFKKMGSRVQIYLGQEVYFTEKLLEDFENGEIGTINNSRYILIELNSRTFDESFIDIVYELRIRNIVPIIAHPERYLYVQRNFKYINRLIDEGCLFQLNAGSLVGIYGEKTEKVAIKLLKNNIYNFIGSDSHNNTNRKNYIKECMEKIEKVNKKFPENSMKDSKKLLLDEEISFKGEKLKDKNIISIFFKG